MNEAMVVAVASALVGAVIGVLGTYVFDLRRSQAERRDREQSLARERRLRRQTIATCLLQDLRRLEFELREVYDCAHPSTIAMTRPALFYDALRSDVGQLAPESVQPVAEFFRRVDHLYGASALLREVGQGRIAPTPQRQYEFRSHAAFALQVLPKAAIALRNEGGVVPGPVEWASVTYPALPPVPEPMFDDAAARLADRSVRPPQEGGA